MSKLMLGVRSLPTFPASFAPGPFLDHSPLCLQLSPLSPNPLSFPPHVYRMWIARQARE